MEMADPVSASEFTRNFGRYRMLAQREAVAVSSHGSITGYFLGPNEYEEFRRFKQDGTVKLSEDKAINASRIDERRAPNGIPELLKRILLAAGILREKQLGGEKTSDKSSRDKEAADELLAAALREAGLLRDD